MSAQGLVLAVGQFPPPYNGFSMMTQALVDVVREGRKVRAVNIAPSERPSRIHRHIVRLVRVLGACWILARHARRGETSVYLGCDGDAGLYLILLLVVTARVLDCPVMLHHHSFGYIHRPRRVMRQILGVGGSGLTHVFLCQTMDVAFRAAYGEAGQGLVLSNAVFVSGDRAAVMPEGLPGGFLTLGHLSNLSREKGLHTFLALFEECRRRGLPVRALLAGPVAGEAESREIERVAAQHPDTFAYVGPVRDQAKLEFYRRTDVFIFATEYVNEAQPVVLFEAAAHGNLIAANRRGCIEGQIPAGSLLVDSPSEFVGVAIEWLYPLVQHPARLQGARRQVINEFDRWKAQASWQLAQLIERL